MFASELLCSVGPVAEVCVKGTPLSSPLKDGPVRAVFPVTCLGCMYLFVESRAASSLPGITFHPGQRASLCSDVRCARCFVSVVVDFKGNGVRASEAVSTHAYSTQVIPLSLSLCVW